MRFAKRPGNNVIEFKPAIVRSVKRLQRLAHAKLEHHAEGRLVVTMTAQRTHDLVNWVIGYGDDAVVIEPPNLKAEVAVIAKQRVVSYDS